MLPHEKQIEEYIKTIEHLKKQSQDTALFHVEITRLEEKLDLLKEEVYSSLTPWQRVMICRHPERPHSIDYLNEMFDSFVELHGDRLYRDDRALLGGLATLGELRCVVLCQEKGRNTESRIAHNFGMMHPEGFRKGIRLMRLAEKFKLPLITFIDTPGAQPTLEAEERGQGWAIAESLRTMASLKTPIITVIIGEGCSGGALALALGDSIGMLEHAYYSVITPEGCASILWKDPGKKIEAAAALRPNAEELLARKIVDTVIGEPLGGAHHSRSATYVAVETFLLDQWSILKRVPLELLLAQRYAKYRSIGEYDE